VTQADKYPIGGYIKVEIPKFTNHKIKIRKGDTYYLFTDGYADQFGGPKGKKFMYKRFREMLLSMQNETMAKQKDILYATLSEWQADLKQIDDMCVIGIRIT